MYNYVSSHGCTQAQGFYLGRPMRGLAFETWYRERNKILTDNNSDKNSDGSSKFMLSH
jgi:predicted signal transduction protein with EAL and GGDEF domain